MSLKPAIHFRHTALTCFKRLSIACGSVSPKCSSLNQLVAINDVIADEVDSINMSIGDSSLKLDDDVVSIGSLHTKGFILMQSSGNGGSIAFKSALTNYLL